MSSPSRQQSPVPRRGSDHRIVVRSRPAQPVNATLLAEAVILLSNQQAAAARNVPAPHLAGIQRLADSRPTAVEEARDD